MTTAPNTYQSTEPPASESAFDLDLGLVRGRPAFSEHWTVPEVPVTEADWHYRQGKLLVSVLDHWLLMTGRKAKVCCNLSVKTRQDKPNVGFGPDVFLVEPPPPDPLLNSLRLWETGHVVPSLAIEIVSRKHPYKDYREIPLQCAAVGVKELVVFDPLLAGPKAGQGPQLLHLWREQSEGTFLRVNYGKRPAYSTVLGASFVLVGEGPVLRIADDHLGQQLWPTAEEAAMAAYERERLQKEEALKEKGDALKEKDEALKEKDEALKEKDEALEENAALTARLAQLQAELDKHDPS